MAQGIAELLITQAEMYYEWSLPRHPYIITYELRQIAGGESIVIMRVIHTSRDWPTESWPEY